jgi:hypothetical protein
MIRQASAVDTFVGAADDTLPALDGTVASRQGLAAAAERTSSDSSAPSSAPLATRDRWQAIEAEIAQLTWSVLDGAASLADRQRLAQLVRAQHQRRS